MATLTIKPTAAGNDIQIKSGSGVITHATFGDTSTVNMSAGTISGGSIASAVIFPTGHVIQMNYTRNTAMDITRTGNHEAPAGTGITCILPNDLQASSKLFAQFSTQLGEESGGHWSSQTFLTFFCNSVDVAPYVTASNNQKAGLASASYVGDSTYGFYMTANVAGSILFTPTGSGAARRTVELAWGGSSSTAYGVSLNRPYNEQSYMKTGCTSIVLMEVAQ